MAKGPKLAAKLDFKHAPAIKDDRFARLQTDPRFLKPNREESKVVVDDRFKDLLIGGLSQQKKIKKLDKYGRKIDGKSANETELEQLSRLYRLEGNVQSKASGSGSSSSASSASNDDDDDDEGKDKAFIDYARGEGVLESSDEDNESDSSTNFSDSESNAGDVTIGNASARRREKQRLRFEDDANEDDNASLYDEDENNISDVAENDLAQLDAQAERTVRSEAAAAAKRAVSSQPQKPPRKGDTHRLAAVNMDWDHMRAIDLYKVFSSLVSPAGVENTSSVRMDPARKMRANSQIAPVKGRVIGVRVYPSQFGIERMTRENREGPPRDIFKRDEEGRVKTKKRSKKSRRKRDDDSDDGDDSDEELFGVDEGGEFDEEALRNYQLERLRYYYAIITFDNPQTARYIMNEVDGTEMERSANVFDLSFVPDEMTFPEEQAGKDDLTDEGWRDEANERSEGGVYKGVDFTTDALRHSKVKLTWDADDPQRSKLTRQLAQQPLSVDELRDEDFKAYLATDSEDSEEEDEIEGGRTSMRALLGLKDGEIDEEDEIRTFGKTKSIAFEDGRKSRMRAEDDGGEGREMQITFMPGLSEAAERRKAGVMIEEKEESTRDKYLRKQREKKEKRRLQGRGENIEVDEKKEGSGGKLGFDDPFFASDNEVDFDAALAEEAKGRKSHKDRPQGKSFNNSHQPRAVPDVAIGRAEVESDKDEDDALGHFSIKDILKAEQEKDGKKSRWAKKKEKKNNKKQGERDQEVQENFVIDVQDERFQGVFDDHRFALDPSHPSFIKTKNMDKLLGERRKRDKRNRKQSGDNDKSKSKHSNVQDGLDELVQSVKKRSLNTVDGPPRKKFQR